MRTVTYSLQQFLTEARRGAYVIPLFQRDFVWNQAQIKLLVDSVSRNYPIGSLLLLQETEPKNPFLCSRSVSAELNGSNQEESPAATGGVFYVLDGQQRLTSLLRVFLQADPEKEYFFDLRKLMDFSAPDQRPPTWMVNRRRGTKVNMQFLRSDLIAEPEKCQVLVDEYYSEHEQSLKNNRADQRKVVARVNKIFETIRNFQIPLVIIDRGEGVEAICRIFETINSTGTRLTTFDLAVARFHPSPDLKQQWSIAFEKFPILRNFKVEGERSLQTIALMLAAKNDSTPEATRGVLLSLKQEQLHSLWDSAIDSLARAYELVESEGATPELLANERLLIPIAMFFHTTKNDELWKRRNPGHLDVLKRWYFGHSLQQGARQAANYRIAQTAAELIRFVKNDAAPSIPEVKLTTDTILSLSTTDSRYKAIHAILRAQYKRDILTGEQVGYVEVEDHHIFPAATAKRGGAVTRKKLDSIANRIIVAKNTNRTLGSQTPSEYIGNIIAGAERNGTLKSQLKIFADACFPFCESATSLLNALKPDNAEEFLNARANIILRKISDLMGDKLVVVETEENDDDDA